MLTYLAGAKVNHEILVALPPSQHKMFLTLITSGIH